jgi:hypothetical protein
LALAKNAFVFFRHLSFSRHKPPAGRGCEFFRGALQNEIPPHKLGRIETILLNGLMNRLRTNAKGVGGHCGRQIMVALTVFWDFMLFANLDCMISIQLMVVNPELKLKKVK